MLMKKVIIIHGWDGSPEEPMHKWLKMKLEEKGFEVIVPLMPNPEEPEIKAWINKIKEILKNPDKETYFIGHSVGCQGVLRYLETLNPDIKIGGAILIAPWMHLDDKTIEEEGEEIVEIAKPWMETPINWKKIKKHSNNFICIFSDNDPYVPLNNKVLFKKNLSAEIIIENNKSHYDPGSNITDNPAALNKLIEISK